MEMLGVASGSASPVKGATGGNAPGFPGLQGSGAETKPHNSGISFGGQ